MLSEIQKLHCCQTLGSLAKVVYGPQIYEEMCQVKVEDYPKCVRVEAAADQTGPNDQVFKFR